MLPKRTIPRICQQCGSDFLAAPQAVKIGKALFCSKTCHYTHMRGRWVVYFWANVQKTDRCWLWIGGTDKGGYGKLMTAGRHRRAHQVAWELAYGRPVPSGMAVCHNCPGGDNPACVNPAHLFLGSIQDNNADKQAKGRQARGASHGSRTKPDQTPRGERNNHARLTADLVRSIRERHANGETCTSLAHELGMGRAAISHIVHRRNWKHVA